MIRLSRRSALQVGTAWALSPAMIAWGQVPATKATPPIAPETKAKAPKVDPYADAVFVKGEPEKPAKGAFTIAVLPDTQHYSEKYPENFLAQTTWLVENQKDFNIASVLHLGDVTNHNSEAEWQNAVKAMDVLNEKLPYAMVPGNHDYSSGGGCKDRTTRMNEYFPLAKIKSLKSLDCVYDKEPDRIENSAHLFSAGGTDFVVIGLEFGPR
ncbi:metallophosphoesterase [Anatilimnocola aggregata]|uniref:metallophosphoesterase n=1 Tax=Anatilimnocola aggregata TaxID=2528021 RepID=UPI001EE457A1|nr:metallophosphoesterase [Anatilimnocola aggregata]